MSIYNLQILGYDNAVTEIDCIQKKEKRTESSTQERKDFMQQVHIRFYGVDQVRQFVNVISKFDTSFDLGSGQRVVDAKSILGVMALDLSGPLRLRYHLNETESETEIQEKIAPFLYSKA